MCYNNYETDLSSCSLFSCFIHKAVIRAVHINVSLSYLRSRPGYILYVAQLPRLHTTRAIFGQRLYGWGSNSTHVNHMHDSDLAIKTSQMNGLSLSLLSYKLN